MKIFRYFYIEIIENHKSIEIEINDDEDPKTYADSLIQLTDYVKWKEDSLITNESDIKFTEISHEQD